MPLTIDGAREIPNAGWTHVSLHTLSTVHANNELSGDGYARAEAAWGPVGLQIQLTSPPVFGAATADWQEIVALGIYNGAGADAVLMGSVVLPEPIRVQSGGTPDIRFQELVFELGDSGFFTPEGFRLLYGNLISPSYVALHSGSPEDDDTELTGQSGYSRKVTSFTLEDLPSLRMNASAVDWGTLGADWTEAPTWVGIWSRVTGGTLLARRQILPTPGVPVTGDSPAFADGGIYFDLTDGVSLQNSFGSEDSNVLGLPEGGTVGQAALKDSSADGDASWQDVLRPSQVEQFAKDSTTAIPENKISALLASLFKGVGISDNVLTFTLYDDTTESVTLPMSSGEVADGVVVSSRTNFSSGMSQAVLTTDTGDEVTVDLSEFLLAADISALQTAAQVRAIIDVRVEGFALNGTSDQVPANRLGNQRFTAGDRTRFDAMEDRATRDQTGTEIVQRVDDTLGNTDWKEQADIDDLFKEAEIVGGVLRLTREDDTVVNLTLPMGSTSVADGVVTSATLNGTTKSVSILTSNGDTIALDLSELAALREVEPFSRVGNPTQVRDAKIPATIARTSQLPDIDDLFKTAEIVGGTTLRLTREDNTVVNLTLPTGTSGVAQDDINAFFKAAEIVGGTTLRLTREDDTVVNLTLPTSGGGGGGASVTDADINIADPSTEPTDTGASRQAIGEMGAALQTAIDAIDTSGGGSGGGSSGGLSVVGTVDSVTYPTTAQNQWSTWAATSLVVSDALVHMLTFGPNTVAFSEARSLVWFETSAFLAQPEVAIGGASSATNSLEWQYEGNVRIGRGPSNEIYISVVNPSFYSAAPLNLYGVSTSDAGLSAEGTVDRITYPSVTTQLWIATDLVLSDSPVHMLTFGPESLSTGTGDGPREPIWFETAAFLARPQVAVGQTPSRTNGLKFGGDSGGQFVYVGRGPGNVIYIATQDGGYDTAPLSLYGLAISDSGLSVVGTVNSITYPSSLTQPWMRTGITLSDSPIHLLTFGSDSYSGGGPRNPVWFETAALLGLPIVPATGSPTTNSLNFNVVSFEQNIHVGRGAGNEIFIAVEDGEYDTTPLTVYGYDVFTEEGGALASVATANYILGTGATDDPVELDDTRLLRDWIGGYDTPEDAVGPFTGTAASSPGNYGWRDVAGATGSVWSGTATTSGRRFQGSATFSELSESGGGAIAFRLRFRTQSNASLGAVKFGDPGGDTKPFDLAIPSGTTGITGQLQVQGAGQYRSSWMTRNARFHDGDGVLKDEIQAEIHAGTEHLTDNTFVGAAFDDPSRNLTMHRDGGIDQVVNIPEADIDDLFKNAEINGGILRLTREDDTVVNLTLPTGTGVADGVVVSATLNATTKRVAIVTSNGDQIVLDLANMAALREVQTWARVSNTSLVPDAKIDTAIARVSALPRTGQLVPAGGTGGQVLGKTSATDYDTTWVDAGEGGSSGGGNTTHLVGQGNFDVTTGGAFATEANSADITLDDSDWFHVAIREGGLATEYHRIRGDDWRSLTAVNYGSAARGPNISIAILTVDNAQSTFYAYLGRTADNKVLFGSRESADDPMPLVVRGENEAALPTFVSLPDTPNTPGSPGQTLIWNPAGDALINTDVGEGGVVTLESEVSTLPIGPVRQVTRGTVPDDTSATPNLTTFTLPLSATGRVLEEGVTVASNNNSIRLANAGSYFLYLDLEANASTLVDRHQAVTGNAVIRAEGTIQVLQNNEVVARGVMSYARYGGWQIDGIGGAPIVAEAGDTITLATHVRRIDSGVGSLNWDGSIRLVHQYVTGQALPGAGIESETINNIRVLTQAQYDAIASPDAGTYYIISG